MIWKIPVGSVMVPAACAQAGPVNPAGAVV